MLKYQVYLVPSDTQDNLLYEFDDLQKAKEFLMTVRPEHLNEDAEISILQGNTILQRMHYRYVDRPNNPWQMIYEDSREG